MTARILAACSPGEIRVVVVDGDTVIDYAIYRPGAPDGVGDIHRARVIARVPAMAGAFVAIAGTEGFLPDSGGAAGQTTGGTLTVQVTRAAQSGKGPRLRAAHGETDDLNGGPAPSLLRRGPSALERLAAQYPTAAILIDSHAQAASLRAQFGPRLTVVPTAFPEAIETEIDTLVSATVAIPGGGIMHIQPTSALIAIDIDAGSRAAARTDKKTAQRAANRAMIPELARQIRLRNLSGAIVVDFAGMPARRRIALAPEFSAALQTDPLHPRFLGFTALGLAEILRPRIHPPLHEQLAGPHATGLAAFRALARDITADPTKQPRLRAAPAIIAALQADSAAMREMTHHAGRPPILRADPTLSATVWAIDL